MMDKDNANIRYAVYDTEAGNVTLLADKKCLVGLLFGSRDPEGAINEENAALYDGIIELNQYFFGQRKTFDLKLHLSVSDEANKVLEYVKSIPYGKTKTYAEVAADLGSSFTSEIVETILLNNPIPLIIPCHRVVKSPTEYGKYRGGDVLKSMLLKMEAKNTNRTFKPGEYVDI